ncbi:MAG: DNA-processing protein DprA [Clostridia bacterium]|jgi:DNA processing protein|nr:DNA-processing protein DprA [Clostridia bacterium]MDH7572403.1 DNA-processing protein DprA [Clostridia bacterium]
MMSLEAQLDRRLSWLALGMIEGIRRQRLFRLVEHAGSPEAAWHLSPADLAQVPGWSERTVAAFVAQRSQVCPGKEYETAKRLGVEIWTWEDEEYPDLLREIADPPLALYARGGRLRDGLLTVAVVGTRRATAYGRQAARRLARELAAAGVCVVSGLARGVDSEAHLGALEAGGFTAAVLGCGADVIYPPESARLFEAIGRKGLILSEYPLGTPPRAANFPARNRIISGLSRGVVVIEAGEKSGALITADLALEQGRDVFAVPGPINNPYSRGANELIKQGAKLVQSAADILEEYGLQGFPFRAVGEPPAMGPEERKVLHLLRGGPVQLEELAEITGYHVSKLARILTHLELKGLVEQLPGKQFVAQKAD